MNGTYLVQLPRAEARYLAGVCTSWLATPEARCVHAVHEWLTGLLGSLAAQVSVCKIARDLGAILAAVPVADRPRCGPLSFQSAGWVLPGHVEYLGAGIVRLDRAAIGSLAGLGRGDDLKVVLEDIGSVLTVGDDRYVVREEEPDIKP